MPHLVDFPSPAIAREAFAGGFAANGKALLTLDDLLAYDPGRGRGAERLFKCPFCGADERAFHVNAQTGRFNCKRASCGVKGLLREFWREAPQTTARSRSTDAVKRAFDLGPLAQSIVPTSGGTPKVGAPGANSEVAATIDASNWRAQWDVAFTLDVPQARAGRDYLRERGVCLETALRAGARFCPNWAPSATGDVYQGAAAILFPLCDLNGVTRAVNGRYLRPVNFIATNTKTGERETKTIKTRTGGSLGESGFWVAPSENFDWRECDALAIVEGPFDALALAACGVAALALNGVNLPSWFARAVAFKAVALGADADGPGEKAADQWAAQISVYTQRAFRLRAPIGCKDFGEVLEVYGRDSLTLWLREQAPLLVPVKENVSEGEEKFSASGEAAGAALPDAVFAPIEVVREAHARGLKTSSLGWPIPYWPGWLEDHGDEPES